jgi:hypothetical protein
VKNPKAGDVMVGTGTPRLRSQLNQIAKEIARLVVGTIAATLYLSDAPSDGHCLDDFLNIVAVHCSIVCIVYVLPFEWSVDHIR